MTKVQLPWKVYFTGNHAAVTRYRSGREAKTTSRYFASKEKAVAFAGDARRVLYCPGEAWRSEA